jgi:hypothetical protein
MLSYELWDDVFINDNANNIFNAFLNTYLKNVYSCFIKKISSKLKYNPTVEEEINKQLETPFQMVLPISKVALREVETIICHGIRTKKGTGI